MSYDYMIPDILAEIRRLRGLMNSMMGQNALANSTGELAPVDFIVDMFDRADSDGIGGYWDPTTQFVLRDNSVIAASTASGTQPIKQLTNIYDHGYGYRVIQADNIYFLPATLGPPATSEFIKQVSNSSTNNIYNPAANTIVRLTSAYRAPLTSPDSTIKITFNGPVPPLMSNRIDIPNPTTTYNYAAWISFITTAGSFFSNSLAGLKIGTALQAFGFPAVDIILLSSPAMMPMDMIFGDLQSGNSQPSSMLSGTSPALSANVGSASATLWTNQLVESGKVTFGSNTLVLTATGNNYDVTLNGSTMFSGPSRLVASRKFVGLAAYGLNLASAAELYGVPFKGITSFKAWRSNISEPASQSGHGIILNGQTVYADKFHIPIIVNGSITGYTYNPNA